MKKTIALCLTAVLLLGLLAGCGSEGGEKPRTATGEYNGQTITMSYRVTDVVYPWDMRSIDMHHGYAVFFDYSGYDENGVNPYPGDRWNLLDREGNRILKEPYMDLTSFNAEGKTVAQKQDGAYVSLNTKLEETPITEQEHLDFCLDPDNYSCSKVYPENRKHVSCINDGLAIYVDLKEEGVSYAGLVDAKGEIIIPAFIPIHYYKWVEHLHLNEDIAFVDDAETRNIGIITITRA